MPLQLELLWYFLPLEGIHTIVTPVLLGSALPQIVHFPLENLCPAKSPVVLPQIVQVLGVVQVASFHVCPNALPSVSPQEQVLGVVQVALLNVCV